MYDLNKVAENSFYIQCPSKIGLIKLNDEEVCLIDSGSDKETGRKIKQILDDNKWKLKAIYNTHSHADHIGGNRYLQERTGCKIYARGLECDFTNHPILEPAMMYGGYPCKELKHKFLMAQSSETIELTNEFLPDGLEIIELPGHSFNMVGFRTTDDVVYLADCLMSKETLDKYGIGFIYDVRSYLETLEKVKNLNAKIFIPSHAEPTTNIFDLAQYNIDKVNEIANKILEICINPQYFESILQQLFEVYALTMNMEQYVLVGSTVRSYLNWLKDNGKLNVCVENNMLLWQSTKD